MTDTPAAGVSVDNKQKFNELQVDTDTRNLKGQNIFILVFPYSVLQVAHRYEKMETCNKSNGRLYQFYQTAPSRKKPLSDFSAIL